MEFRLPLPQSKTLYFKYRGRLPMARSAFHYALHGETAQVVETGLARLGNEEGGLRLPRERDRHIKREFSRSVPGEDPRQEALL